MSQEPFSLDQAQLTELMAAIEKHDRPKIDSYSLIASAQKISGQVCLVVEDTIERLVTERMPERLFSLHDYLTNNRHFYFHIAQIHQTYIRRKWLTASFTNFDIQLMSHILSKEDAETLRTALKQRQQHEHNKEERDRQTTAAYSTENAKGWRYIKNIKSGKFEWIPRKRAAGAGRKPEILDPEEKRIRHMEAQRKSLSKTAGTARKLIRRRKKVKNEDQKDEDLRDNLGTNAPETR